MPLRPQKGLLEAEEAKEGQMARKRSKQRSEKKYQSSKARMQGRDSRARATEDSFKERISNMQQIIRKKKKLNELEKEKRNQEFDIGKIENGRKFSHNKKGEMSEQSRKGSEGRRGAKPDWKICEGKKSPGN